MKRKKINLWVGSVLISLFLFLSSVGFAEEMKELSLVIERAKENIKKVDEEFGVGVVKEEHFEEEIYVQQKEELVEEAQGDIEKLEESLVLLPEEIQEEKPSPPVVISAETKEPLATEGAISLLRKFEGVNWLGLGILVLGAGLGLFWLMRKRQTKIPVYAGPEKRRWQRYNLESLKDKEISLKIERQSQPIINAMIRNISYGGLCFECSRKDTISSPMKLRLSLKSVTLPIEADTKFIRERQIPHTFRKEIGAAVGWSKDSDWEVVNHYLKER